MASAAQIAEALARHWDEVLAAVPAAARATVLDLAADLAAGGAGAALDLLDLLEEELPPGHPFLVAVEVEVDRSQAVALDVEVVWAELRGRLGEPAAPPSWESQPMLTPAQVTELGGDPRAPGLIRLDLAGRGLRLPSFQFGPGGAPLPVVLEVNDLLDSEDDPWGVADWWLGTNGWLGAAPAALIGEVPDGRLLAAANAVTGSG